MDDTYASMPPEGMNVSLTLDQGGDYNDTQIVSVSEPEQTAPAPTEITKDMDPESVYVWANSINPASSAGSGNMVAFDVIFSVSCTCPDTGTNHTFQVVKRIAVDKMKMAHEAKSGTPVSVVENKKPEPEKFALTETAERWKRLAGIK